MHVDHLKAYRTERALKSWIEDTSETGHQEVDLEGPVEVEQVDIDREQVGLEAGGEGRMEELSEGDVVTGDCGDEPEIVSTRVSMDGNTSEEPDGAVLRRSHRGPVQLSGRVCGMGT